MNNTIDDAIAEAVQIVLGLTPDELAKFARRVAMANNAQADRLADALLDAVYDAAFVEPPVGMVIGGPALRLDDDGIDYLEALF